MREEHYLYAIVRGPTPAWRPPPSGVDGAAVTSHRLGDLVVLGSRLATVPAPGPHRVGAHHEVVASALDAEALLPFSYGTAVAGVLEEWLTSRRATVDAALARLGGHVEMSVKLLRLNREDGSDTTALRQLRDRLVECARIPHWCASAAPASGNVVGGVAFLVPREDVPSFLARIAPVASRAHGVAVVPTGPWPAYSFAPPLAGRPPARVDAGGDARRLADGRGLH